MTAKAAFLPTDTPGYFFNKETGFIVNMNKIEKELYAQAVKKAQEQEQLRSELNELRSMLKELLQTNG